MLLKLKKIGILVLEKCGWIDRKWRDVSDSTLILLMYHRILPKEHVPGWVQSGMYVEEETFETHAAYIKEHFRVVPLESFINGINSIGDPQECRPRCALTFDDGWADFAAHALPLLQKYELPATVFIPTGYIGTKEWFWTDRIAYLFYERRKSLGGELDIPVKGKLERKVAQIERKWFGKGSIEGVIRFLKGISEEEINALINGLEEGWGISSVPPGRAFLSWEEVRGVAESGIVSIGSHTHRHRILTGLNEEEIREELTVSRKRLQMELPNTGKKEIFCYPSGEYNDRIAGLVKETGYSLAVTTDTGWNNNATDRYRLMRVGIHQDMSETPAMLSCRMLRYL